jgi:type VI secretion system protein ImpJ
MTVETPLFWHQGQFLQPQHFQLLERSLAARADGVATHGLPYFWGVGSMQVNEAALATGVFEITRGEFIFQDGARIALPDNAAIAARSFADAWTERDKPFMVYLGLRKWDDAGPNVEVVRDREQAAHAASRLAAETGPAQIPDMHGDGPPAQVRFARYVPRLFWETDSERFHTHHVFPIARLFAESDSVQLDRGYVPPCLHLAASDQLRAVAEDMRDRITARRRQLEDYKSPRGMQTLELDAGYTLFLMALRTLNRYSPLLRHLTEDAPVHPWTFYGVLRQLVGELSTFSFRYDAEGGRTDRGAPPETPRTLPAYDHTNVAACLLAATDIVGELLDAIVIGPEHLVNLTYDGSAYTGDIPQGALQADNEFWLVILSDDPPQRTAESVRRTAKAGAVRDMQTLISRALPGIPLEYSPDPPPGLPRRGRSVYFRIDVAHPGWDRVRADGRFALFWDDAPQDAAIDLAILRG